MWPIPSASQAENSPWVGSSSAPRSDSPTHCSLQLLAFLAELLILSSQPFFCKKWLIFSMNSFLSLFYDYKKLATQRPMFILNCSHSSSKLWVFSLIQLSWKLHGFPMIWLRFTTVESGLTLLPLSFSLYFSQSFPSLSLFKIHRSHLVVERVYYYHLKPFRCLNKGSYRNITNFIFSLQVSPHLKNFLLDGDKR